MTFLAGLLAVLTSQAQMIVSAKPTAPREIRELGGVHAVSRPLETVSDLQTLVAELRSDFVELLEKVSWEGSPADLFRAIEEGRIAERTFPVGGRLQWMAYRTPAGVDLYRDVLWAGKEAFEAFEVRILSNDWRWAFIIPKACGNLALFSRAGAGDLDVSVTTGVLKLTDPEGREIVVRGGESATVTAPLEVAGEPRRRGEAGVETSLKVEEGRVELHDYGHPISVVLEGGNTVSATITPAGRLALAVPETNPGPLPIRVGDAVGTLSAGAGLSTGWSSEVEDAEPPEVRIGFTSPHFAPRSGLHAHWILGRGAEIEVEVADAGSGVDRWVPVIDGEQTSPETLRGPWTVGGHTVAVLAIDGAGNRRQTDPIPILYDADPPDLSWGVEGIGPMGPAGSVADDDPESPPPSFRGRRLLRVGGRKWEIDSDFTQVVVRPQGKKVQHFGGIDVPLGPDRGLWVLAEDEQCADYGNLTYDLAAEDDRIVLRIEAVDCAGNARRGRFPLARR